MSLYPLHAASPEHPRIRGHELPHQREELIADAAARLSGRLVDVWTIATDFGHTDESHVWTTSQAPAGQPVVHSWMVIPSQPIPVLK